MSTDAIAPVAPEIDHEALDEDYVLTPAFVEKVVDAADDGDDHREIRTSGNYRKTRNQSHSEIRRNFSFSFSFKVLFFSQSEIDPEVKI